MRGTGTSIDRMDDKTKESENIFVEERRCLLPTTSNDRCTNIKRIKLRVYEFLYSLFL